MIELEALERLKPCPFCGSNNYAFLKFLKSKQEVVQCDSCEAMGPRYGHNGALGHKEAWNTRADPKPLPWLRAEEVTEPGHYWYFWQKDGRRSKPAAMYVSQGDEGTIVVHARGGITPVDMGGLWQRIPEPELPKEESA